LGDDLAAWLKRSDRFQEVEKAYRLALAHWEKLGPRIPNRSFDWVRWARSYNGLAALLFETGRPKEAEQLLRQALVSLGKSPAHLPSEGITSSQAGPLSARLRVHLSLASLLEATNRPLEAEKEYRQAIAMAEQGMARQEDENWKVERYRGWAGDLATALNDLAWHFATYLDLRFRDPIQAVELAKKATRLAPDRNNQNTLGVALYRAGEWKEAVEALEKNTKQGVVVSGREVASDFFFLAMTHWQLGDKEKAREWYQKAIQWMDKDALRDEELRRFRAEAEDLLCIKETPKP
jgi:tetratricopeptide (TPR) repeat protein